MCRANVWPCGYERSLRFALLCITLLTRETYRKCLHDVYVPMGIALTVRLDHAGARSQQCSAVNSYDATMYPNTCVDSIARPTRGLLPESIG